MSSVTLEAFLARLYTDAQLRRRFLDDPLAVSRDSGLDEDQARAMAAIDRVGLRLAAASYTAKRNARSGGRGQREASGFDRLRRFALRIRAVRYFRR